MRTGRHGRLGNWGEAALKTSATEQSCWPEQLDGDVGEESSPGSMEVRPEHGLEAEMRRRR
jgi:hypothetical protein